MMVQSLTVQSTATRATKINHFPHSRTQADIPLRRQADLSSLELMPCSIRAFMNASLSLSPSLGLCHLTQSLDPDFS